jgi:hypothetical protein
VASGGGHHRQAGVDMNMVQLGRSLSRTLLLMRDEVGPGVDDDVLLDVLTSVRVVLVADAANIASHAAQTAFVTAAMLMARSGHKVFLVAPEVSMVGPQPPLRDGMMVAELVRAGKDLLPGIHLIAGEPEGEVDLLVALGDTPCRLSAHRRIRPNAEPWAGIITREDQARPWSATLWPFGALTAAALGAGEAFKIAMQKLLPHAVSLEHTAARFANTEELKFELATGDTPFCRDLGQVDCVSGGAVTQAVLYCLARIPGVIAQGRIIEPDTVDISNLNRCMLLLGSDRNAPKASVLADILRARGLCLQSLNQRYDRSFLENSAPLAPTVVVGVDDIPTRWVAQAAAPDWLVIGATTHWSAMASIHTEGLACAHCLHNQDEPDQGPARTTACVSFWAGLLPATYLVRHAAGRMISANKQQVFLTPFRPENPFWSAVAARTDCPTCRSVRTKWKYGR